MSGMEWLHSIRPSPIGDDDDDDPINCTHILDIYLSQKKNDQTSVWIT
jgi:hypothetical protein